MTVNRQVLLASRPQGAVSEANFRIVEVPMPRPPKARCWCATGGFRSIRTCAGA